jgi:hypothetical protein
MNPKALFAIKKNENEDNKSVDLKSTKFKIIKKRLPWTIEVN